MNLNYIQRFTSLDLNTQKYLLDMADLLNIKKSSHKKDLPKIDFGKPITANNIILAVSLVISETPDLIRSDSRRRELVHAINMAIYVMRSRGFSLKGIGEIFGSRHHATVLYAIEKHEKLITEDTEYRNNYKLVLAKLRSNEY